MLFRVTRNHTNSTGGILVTNHCHFMVTDIYWSFFKSLLRQHLKNLPCDFLLVCRKLVSPSTLKLWHLEADGRNHGCNWHRLLTAALLIRQQQQHPQLSQQFSHWMDGWHVGKRRQNRYQTRGPIVVERLYPNLRTWSECQHGVCLEVALVTGVAWAHILYAALFVGNYYVHLRQSLNS